MKLDSGEKAAILNRKIVDILEQDYQEGEILKKLGINPRKKENEYLLHVCMEQKLDEHEVLLNLDNLENARKISIPNSYHSWPKDFLIQYIKYEHHDKFKSLLEEVADYKKRICAEQEDKYDELKQIEFYVDSLTEKLKLNLKFKKEKFYPSAVAFLTKNLKTDGKVRSMERQIKLIKKDHVELTYIVQRMKEVGNNFIPPEEASAPHRLLFSSLKMLSTTLQAHHFLEEKYLLSSVEDVLWEIKN